MKKVLSLFLCVWMILAAFAGCASEGAEESTAPSTEPQIPHVLKVGYARVDISPEESVPMAGRIAPGAGVGVGQSTSDYMSKDVKDPLYVTCIAISDEKDNTVLLMEIDILNCWNAPIMDLKMAVARKTGLTGNQIMICAPHNHSAPDLNSSEPSIERYYEKLRKQIADVAVAAMEDSKPAKMYTASTTAENMNFVRHYLMDDGSYVGDNFGTTKDKQYVGHVREPDDQMQLIKFVREGGKDVVLMNWQAHPRGHSEHKQSILSDVDIIRKALEEKLDCQFAYFLGASGNVNSRSRIADEMITATYEEHGRKLAEIAAEAARNFKEVSTGQVKIINQSYAGTSKEDETTKIEMPLFAISFGEVAFITAPYEMFTESGIAIKEGSPFETTFVATCANGSYSYIPSKPTFEYGGYEVTSTKFVPGTAELLVEEYISMLKDLQKTE